MGESVEVSILAEGRPGVLRELHQFLVAAGHDVRLLRPPTSAPGDTRLWLVVASEGYEAAKADLDRRLDEGLSDEERKAAGSTIDLDAEEGTCPACSTKMRPQDMRCPECGLRFHA